MPIGNRSQSRNDVSVVTPPPDLATKPVSDSLTKPKLKRLRIVAEDMKLLEKERASVCCISAISGLKWDNKGNNTGDNEYTVTISIG